MAKLIIQLIITSNCHNMASQYGFLVAIVVEVPMNKINVRIEEWTAEWASNEDN